jgi:hypothetical protein
MNKDPLKQYVILRRQLEDERSRMEKRLRDINDALSQSRSAGSAVTASAQEGKTSRGSISVKQAVIQVTAKRPLSKQEILEELNGMGVVIGSADPFNYLNTILYGKNPRFKREDGKFSLGAGGRIQRGIKPPVIQRPGRRKPSAKPLAKMSAAARPDWARQKSAGNSKKL